MTAHQTSLARPYAKALFAEALAQDQVDAWQTEMTALVTALEDAKVQQVIHSRVISRAQKLAAIHAGIPIKDSMPGRLATLLVKNDRLQVMADIATQFISLRSAHENRQAITITAPYALSRQRTKEIADKLQKHLTTTPEITTEIDPRLIAGVRIFGSGWVIEANMQAQLTRLSQQLTS